ncbi:hypothetical protein [Haloarcula sp. JP-L23]|uniref:DUF7553 family protein n=1 Tax=Haloarcula sp. JP-L23 TaxID=2716717 RepID=UPI00140E974E|nr:hypothetical protein G9465_23050 [Haloarcula sp. JP-L23]
MSRDDLMRAVKAVEAASDAVADPAVRERLDQLAEHLRLQAERDGTPALGALDRIQYALHDIATHTNDSVTTQVEHSRDLIFDFLETLDDRGMTQHGLPVETHSNESE